MIIFDVVYIITIRTILNYTGIYNMGFEIIMFYQLKSKVKM